MERNFLLWGRRFGQIVYWSLAIYVTVAGAWSITQQVFHLGSP